MPSPTPHEASTSNLSHYVFFELQRERIHDASFLKTPALEGAQLKYTWPELEPSKDVYDFRAIHNDLAFLTSRKKRLFIQLQDATFSPALVYVPKYLRDEARFHGGADAQYIIDGQDEAHARVEGWVARRWDPAVRERFHRLLFALGKAFDGKIEGINLPETALDLGDSGRLYPKGFTPTVYRDGILANLAALKRAFPGSTTLLYANFMPGEWLPDNDRHYLKSVYQGARALGVGVAGPDMEPYKPSQMYHSYPLIRAARGSAPTGIAVQDGNYDYTNPRTGKRITIPELLDFAQDYLQVHYLFWCTEEPFYSQALLPFLARSPARSLRASPGFGRPG